MVEIGSPPMVSIAYKATSHVTAWVVWHCLGVSLLDDLDVPRPPGAEQPFTQAV
jgi:hypothetical protein